SGWDFSIAELRRYYERITTRLSGSDSAPPPSLLDASQGSPSIFDSLERWYMSTASTLGRRTAELHRTLASGQGADFPPQPLGRAARRALADDMRAHAAATLDMLAQRLDGLGEASRVHAEAVLSQRTTLLSRLD